MIKEPQAEIITKQQWSDYFLFTLKAPGIARSSHPGEFVMIRISTQFHPLLRRPFSLHYAEGDNIQIFFQISGLGTEILSRKKVSETLDILGPLGQGFNVDMKTKNPKIAVIGGGKGIAPLYFLCMRLRSSGLSQRIYYGGKSIKDIPLRKNFLDQGFDILCSTDDGSFGYPGMITDLFLKDLETNNIDQVFACGPDAMMATIDLATKKRQIPAQFSLESMMGCGFGACWGCVRKIRKNGQEQWLKICEDGPVFSGKDIIWEVKNQ